VTEAPNNVKISSTENTEGTEGLVVRSRLGVEVGDRGVAIRLNHPPLNVIDVEMMEQLASSLTEIETQREIAVIVLSGSDRAFSVGVDVAAHTPGKVSEMLTKFHALIRAVVGSRKITVAAIRGHCLGGGAELAMVCDLVYTTDNATWGFPEIKLGCFPPVAAAALSALVGQKRAAELIFTGRSITGAEAARLGLANRAVPNEELDSVARETVGQISALSPQVLSITKKTLYGWDAVHFDKGLARAEKIYLEELVKTEDMREGVNAFLEKRMPLWRTK
jgi:cyclohexa-1,5-dienecarbonyl-CoA hydratase